MIDDMYCAIFPASMYESYLYSTYSKYKTIGICSIADYDYKNYYDENEVIPYLFNSDFSESLDEIFSKYNIVDFFCTNLYI